VVTSGKDAEEARLLAERVVNETSFVVESE
jgi:hypothetical protein